MSLLLPGDKHSTQGKSEQSLVLKIAQGDMELLNSGNDVLWNTDHLINESDHKIIETIFKKQTENEDDLVIDIHISDSEVLTRRISLPASTEENIYEVIQYEMDRYTPFNNNDVYFDYRIEGRDKDKQLIKVLLIVVRKEILNPVINLIENSDAHVRIQTINIDANNPEHALQNVKLLRSYGEVGKSNKSSVKWLAIAALCLLLLTGITPLAINYVHISKLSSELAGLEKTVQKVKLLQKEYTKTENQVGYLINIKERNPSIIELLNLLTHALPDHSYVQRLSLEGGLLSIQGLSASASELIPIIDKTSMFDDIRFAAPVTQSGAERLERYSITAQIKLP